jgi:hypothetical protein
MTGRLARVALSATGAEYTGTDYLSEKVTIGKISGM